MGREASAWQPATAPSRVLLIEPNAQLRRAVHALLQLENYLVWPARDVECGLAMLRAARWPVVVLLSVSPAAILRDDVNALLLRAVTTSGATQWPQHAFLVATTSPEYLCAMVDWLPEGLNLSVLRQPYNVSQLLHTVALAAHSLRIMRESALRYLPPRHTPRDARLLQPLAMPAQSAAAALAVSGSRPDAATVGTVRDDSAAAASDAPVAAPELLTESLRAGVERLRACAQRTRERLQHTRGVIENGYAQHVKLVAAVERWRL